MSNKAQFSRRFSKRQLFQSCKNGSLVTIQRLLGNTQSNRETQIDVLLDEDGNTALIVASENRHISIVQFLLEHGVNADTKNRDGWTALIKASKNGDSNLEIIELLLRNGAQVDIQNNEGDSALIVASQNRQAKAVKALLDCGANANIKNNDGWTALMKASQVGCTEIVQQFLDQSTQVDEQNIDGESALTLASENRYIEIVRLLLVHGAKLHTEKALVEASESGRTDITKVLVDYGTPEHLRRHGAKGAVLALGNACARGHEEVVEALLDEIFADHNYSRYSLTNSDSESDDWNSDDYWLKRDIEYDMRDGLIEASENGHTDVVYTLLVRGARHGMIDALMRAILNGHPDTADMLESFGAHVDYDYSEPPILVEASKNGELETVKLILGHEPTDNLAPALIEAKKNSHTDIIQILLEHCTKIDKQSWLLEPPLVQASEEGDAGIVELLLHHGITNYGGEALVAAAKKGHINIIKLILENVDTIHEGYMVSAMVEASGEGSIESVKLLNKHGANVNLQNEVGRFALKMASLKGHIKIAQLLLEYGADVNLRTNNDGTTALMVASQNGHSEVVDLLLNHNAEVNMQNNDGYYALMYASQEGHIKILEQLLNHGADKTLKDKSNKTALSVAKNNIVVTTLEGDYHLDLETEEEMHLTAVENAIKERGTLDHTLIHGVFVGPPRSGKDSVMKRLLGEKATDKSPSTGVAEKVVHVKVEESSTFAATVDQSNWARLAYDEEAVHLMKTASNKSSNMNQLPKENSNKNDIAQSTVLTIQQIEKISEQTKEKSTVTQIKMTSSEESLMPQFMLPLEEIFQPQSQSTRPHRSPMEIFKEALKSKGLEGLKKQLSKSWSLYLTNTGGQMEFQELLPLLVSGPSIFFITFQLHKDLNQHFSVEYELPSGKSSKSYQSSLSILEAILQTLSSISAMGTYVYKGLQRKAVPLRPKVFIIGTHKDLLNKKSAETEIKRIDQHLQAVIKPTSHYQDGIIQFASESQMIFAVNNHDPDDSDFHRIRNSVEKVVETGDYRMRSPAHWMIYSLVIRQLQNRVESYDECFAIAKECGIRDTNEFNEALHFIHTKMGLIRYFPHEQLKDIVIVDPQILFEKVTELIVETFTFDKVCNHSKLEIFKNMGIFNLSDFIRISSQTGQNLTPPLFAKLLEYLRIAARFQQSGETKYFLPCALTHAQAKQSDYTSNIPSLIVTFQCGYCPKGLFGILITYLINNEMESEFEWELDTEKIYRDEVCFQVGPYDTVTVRFLTTHLEIKLLECDHEISRINCTVEVICQEIYQSVEKGIKTATSAINYINAQHSFTFYCTSESCSKDPHPAKPKKLKEKLCSLKCDKLNKVLPLPSGCEKWQLDSQPQISKGTVILPHSSSQHTLSEFGTRLKKQHLTLLYGQLSGHASKWRDIGIYLKFLSNELDIIEAKPSLYHEGTKGFLREMISEWLEWAPGDQRGSEQYATLEALKIAVSSAGLGTSAADLTITVATTNSAIGCTVHNLSHSASASAIKLGRKRNYEKSTEKPNPKRPQLE